MRNAKQASVVVVWALLLSGCQTLAHKQNHDSGDRPDRFERQQQRASSIVERASSGLSLNPFALWHVHQENTDLRQDVRRAADLQRDERSLELRRQAQQTARGVLEADLARQRQAEPPTTVNEFKLRVERTEEVILAGPALDEESIEALRQRQAAALKAAREQRRQRQLARDQRQKAQQEDQARRQRLQESGTCCCKCLKCPCDCPCIPDLPRQPLRQPQEFEYERIVRLNVRERYEESEQQDSFVMRQPQREGPCKTCDPGCDELDCGDPAAGEGRDDAVPQPPRSSDLTSGLTIIRGQGPSVRRLPVVMLEVGHGGDRQTQSRDDQQPRHANQPLFPIHFRDFTSLTR